MFDLFKETTEVSQACHPKVVEKQIIHEWEGCTSDPSVLEKYKKVLEKYELWAPH